MALTLIEAAKQFDGDVKRQAVIELIADSSQLFAAVPFENITGNAISYDREETLPGVAFRGVNEAYTEDAGVLNPLTEKLSILGGDLDVDRFIVQTMSGDSQRSTREAMKLKAIGLRWVKTFLKGDSSDDPRSFDGLQARLTSSQIIEAGSSSGGDALSLAKLDEMIDSVVSPTHLIMNKTMRRRLTAAARTYTIGGFITMDQDEFGRQQTFYNGLPIIAVDYDEAGSNVLGFSESGSGGGSAVCTSIYCASIGPGMVMGLQNGDIAVEDLGQVQDKPVFRTRVEWYTGMAVYHGRAAARLRGIKNAAITA